MISVFFSFFLSFGTYLLVSTESIVESQISIYEHHGDAKRASETEEHLFEEFFVHTVGIQLDSTTTCHTDEQTDKEMNIKNQARVKKPIAN